MAGLVALTAAVVAAGVIFMWIRRPPAALSRPPHVRTNYRGWELPGTLGVLLVGALGLGGLGAAVLAVTGRASWSGTGAVVGTGVVMGTLGLADDVWGDRSAGGFVGHLRMLVRGRVTTGLVKAVGGGLVGLGAAWLAGHRGWWLLWAGMVVALTANLVNLLDVRPGRALKVWIVGWAAVTASGPAASALVCTSGLAGGVVAFLPLDLRERAMLGDAGANLCGGALGAAIVVSVGHTPLVGVLVGLLALTALSEVVSFTKVIEHVPPLRAIDRLGRLPPEDQTLR